MGLVAKFLRTSDAESPNFTKIITDLEIQNFRGFQRLKLEGLRRVNLLLGGNDTGKTRMNSSPASEPRQLTIILPRRALPPMHSPAEALTRSSDEQLRSESFRAMPPFLPHLSSVSSGWRVDSKYASKHRHAVFVKRKRIQLPLSYSAGSSEADPRVLPV